MASLTNLTVTGEKVQGESCNYAILSSLPSPPPPAVEIFCSEQLWGSSSPHLVGTGGGVSFPGGELADEVT